MKIVHIETLISYGSFTQSQEWQSIHSQVLLAVKSVDWPINSGKFTIYPKRQANGVKAIKNSAIKYLVSQGWEPEYSLSLPEAKRPGKIDAAYTSNYGTIAFEWETGNISSSHRSLNKIALGLLTNSIIAGILVIPSRKLYRFLTDRVGNYDELKPYFLL